MDTRLTFRHYFLFAVLFGVLLLTYRIFLPFFAPLSLGVVFAVVLRPVYEKILSRFNGRKALASAVTVLATIIVILIPTTIIGGQLLSEAQQMYATLTDGTTQATLLSGIRNAGPALEAFLPGAEAKTIEFANSIDEYTKVALTWLIEHLGVAFSGLTSLALDLFIFFVTLYYLLKDGHALRASIIELSPLKDRDDETIFIKLEQAVNSVVKGKLAIALIQGVFAGIGLAVFGIPNPVLWGLIATIAALVPPFGTGVVMAPAVLYLFLSGAVAPAIGLAIWGGIAGILDNLVGPTLMSHGTDLHPLLVLLGVLGGIAYFGPVGIFLGPLAVSLLLALISVYHYVPDQSPVASQ